MIGRGSGEEEIGSYHLTATEFQFKTTKNFRRWMGFRMNDGASTYHQRIIHCRMVEMVHFMSPFF